MFKPFRIGSLLFAAMIFSSGAQAHITDQTFIPDASCGDRLYGRNPDVAAEVEAMFRRYPSNLGIRGYDNSNMANTAENRDLLKKYGFLWWYTQGFFAPSEEAALAHAKRFTGSIQDHFLIGLYFIGTEDELGVGPGDPGNEIDAAKMTAVLARGAVEIEYLDTTTGKQLTTPNVRRLTGAELLDRINLANVPAKFVRGNDRSLGSNYVNFFGWHTGKIRGIIDHAEYLQSKRYRRLVSLYMSLYDAGYRAVFNPQDPAVIADAMDVLKNTQRMKQVHDEETGETVTKELPLSINRHAIAGTQYIEDGLAKGSWYLSVLRDPLGRVVGGEPGVVHNMEGETILYSRERSADLPELTTGSQIAMAMVVQDSVRQGVDYSSSGPMVSTYSALNNTRVVPTPEALKMLARNHQDPSRMSVDREWNPYAPDDKVAMELTDARLKAAARLASISIGNSNFVSSRPAPNAETSARVEALGLALQPGLLRVRVVPSFQAAQDEAKHDPAAANSTLFVVLADPPAREGLSASQYLAAILKNVPGLEVVSFRKPEQGAGVRRYDYGFLAPRLSLEDYPAARFEPGTGTLEIPGWSKADSTSR